MTLKYGRQSKSSAQAYLVPFTDNEIDKCNVKCIQQYFIHRMLAKAKRYDYKYSTIIIYFIHQNCVIFYAADSFQCKMQSIDLTVESNRL